MSNRVKTKETVGDMITWHNARLADLDNMANQFGIDEIRKAMMAAEHGLEIRALSRFPRWQPFSNLGEAYGLALLDERRKLEVGQNGRKEAR